MPRTQKKKIVHAAIEPEKVRPKHWRIGEDLAVSLDEMKARIAAKKASMMVIDGQVGTGKTTLAVGAADYYQGSEIDLDKQLAMGFDQFVMKLNWCVENGKTVIIYDESGDADKRGAMSKLNRFLNRIFDTFRAFKILIIMVLPNFSILESQLFLKAIPRFLAHIDVRDMLKGEYRLWSLYGMMWLKHHMANLVIPFDAYSKVATRYGGKFYDLDPVRSRQLDALSTAAKKQILQDFATEVSEKEDEKKEDARAQSEKDLLRARTREISARIESARQQDMLANDLERRRLAAALRGAVR